LTVVIFVRLYLTDICNLITLIKLMVLYNYKRLCLNYRKSNVCEGKEGDISPSSSRRWLKLDHIRWWPLHNNWPSKLQRPTLHTHVD